MPFSPPAICRLIDSFFARRTMFSIMAPEEKSLKNRISLSPFWYVTSRKRFSSPTAYMRSTAASIIASMACVSPPAVAALVSSSEIGRSSVR